MEFCGDERDMMALLLCWGLVLILLMMKWWVVILAGLLSSYFPVKESLLSNFYIK